ncbi:MAG: hypothetical protein LBS99_04510 [Clostridiales bacterium]|jgi:hypothetical protein|nr:hypothetical protein [Clostridiales bacterium]
MKKKLITLTLCLLVASATAMSGCAGGDPTNDGNTVPPGASPLTQMEAVAPETGNVPKVLDSFTDGTSNYYLLDAGYIKGVFISKLTATTYDRLRY